MKKFIVFCVFLVLSGLLLCLPDTYSGMDGETLFELKCGKCHRSGGESPVFSPVKYASVQWKRFFEREKHKRKKDISNDVTSEEIAAISQYLIDHAADSDRPIAAGLR